MSKPIEAKKFFGRPKTVEEFTFLKIKKSIETSLTSDYQKLIFFQKQDELSWISQLTYSLLINLDATKALDRIIKAPQVAAEMLEAKLEHIAPGQLSAKLSVRGVDQISGENLRAAFFGGDYKDENGEKVLVFDAHSSVDKRRIQAAANELTDYFRKQFQKEFGDYVNNGK